MAKKRKKKKEKKYCLGRQTLPKQRNELIFHIFIVENVKCGSGTIGLWQKGVKTAYQIRVAFDRLMNHVMFNDLPTADGRYKHSISSSLQAATVDGNGANAPL